MVSNWGWQDHERGRKITDLTIFLKIKTGNVRISFPNELREVHCPYFPRASHSINSSSSVARLPLTRTSTLFSLEMFPLGTPCFLLSYLLILLLRSTQVFIIILCIDDSFFIWLVILFVFTYLFVFILFIYFAVNVMSFRVLTVQCQISSLEAIMSIKEKEKKNGLQIMSLAAYPNETKKAVVVQGVPSGDCGNCKSVLV